MREANVVSVSSYVRGVGMNINTVPVVAVGIGVGIDYAIYVMDRIREETQRLGEVRAAVHEAICTTGLAITFTATTLVAGVVLWIFLSSLRFQADSATLLVLMMIVNMAAGMVFVPAWIMIFEPAFIRGEGAAEAESEDAGAARRGAAS